jgi:hypothetical protein
MIFGVVLLGCSGGAKKDPVDPGSNGGGSAKSSELPVGPPHLFQGEHFSYVLNLQGVELATYDFVVGDPTDFDGKKVVQVQSHAKAIGLVQMIANVDDFFISYIDASTGRPLYWKSDEFATKSTDREVTEAHLDQRQGDMIPVDFHLNKDAPAPEPQKVSFPEVWDYNSLMIAFRGWEGGVGSTVTGEVFRSRFLWHYKITIHGKESLSTKIGDFPALRIDGHVFKVDRSGKEIAADDERDFSIWVSDDDGRVPLLIVAKTDYGDMKMSITGYDPGSAGK